MKQLIAAALMYYVRKLGLDDVESELYAKQATFCVAETNSAGAWIDINTPKREPGDSDSPARTLSGLWASLNGETTDVSIQVYAAGANIRHIELSAPMDDFPEMIQDFRLFEWPRPSDIQRQ
jgi:hypothetical protein